MIKKFLLFLGIILLTLFVTRADKATGDEPMRELRAVWLTSAWNIDWPHSQSVSAINQQNRLRDILDVLYDANINAVLFQVRPNADALYQSAYEPWAHWITGNRGQDPGYDPLAFVIKEANIRGMEVHAWLNPYRFENVVGQFSGKPGDYAETHPDLIFTHNNRTYFDPGRPGTTQLIKKIIADLIENYDLDGIVFDDYFYPSGMPLSADQETWDNYATPEFVLHYYSTFTRNNFRRASVNNMIKEVHDTIKHINPNIVFGVSPAGIYSTSAAAANHWGTTLPSGITGNDNFNVIFCDPLAWLWEGSVDYISPQLYWPIGSSQDFVTLTSWWGFQAARFNLHSYPSLASYRIYPQKDEFYEEMQHGFFKNLLQLFKRNEESGTSGTKYNWPVSEIGNQIIANRQNQNNLADGLIFYNTSSFVNPTKDLAGYLADDLFSEKAIFPLLDWFPSVEPGAPVIAETGAIGEKDDAAVLSVVNTNATRYMLYGWEEMPTAKNKNTPEYMHVVFGEDMALFRPKDFNYFAVAEFMPDKTIGNVSEPAYYEYLAPVEIIKPDNETVCDMFEFSWSSHEGADAYQLLISNKQNPNSFIYISQLLSDNNYLLPSGLIPGKSDYVARVRTVSDDLVSFSAPAIFSTDYPQATSINAPAHGAVNVNLQTTVQWNTVPNVMHYHLQVVKGDVFIDENLVVDHEPISNNFFGITLNDPGTQHMVRVRAVNQCGYAYWSPANSFTTTGEVFVADHDDSFLNAYPNPAHNFFMVDYPNVLRQRTISIFNHEGQVVRTVKKTEDSSYDRIDIESLPHGLYVVTIVTENQERFTVKIVKSQ